MKRISHWKKIQAAIESGMVREEGERAEPGQILTYILSDKRLFPHATLHSAKAEKDFLEAVLGSRIRIYKVWNTERQSVHDDMTLIRSEADKLSKRTNFYKALNRVLEGAGF